MARTLLFFCLFAVTGVQTTYNVSSIVLGTALRVNYPPKCNPVKCGLRLSLDRLNADQLMLPNTQVIFREIDTNCSQDAAAKAMLNGAAPYWGNYTAGVSGPMIGVIGTACTSAAWGASNIASYGMIPLVSYAATAPSLSVRKSAPVRSPLALLLLLLDSPCGSNGGFAVVFAIRCLRWRFRKCDHYRFSAHDLAAKYK